MNLVIPKPPSINHIYGYTSRGGFARSYITKEGKQFFADATAIIKDFVSKNNAKTHIEEIDGELVVNITLYTRRNQDIDNIIKPVLDVISGVCMECGTKHSARKQCDCGKNESILEDDRFITELSVKKVKIKSPEEERVEINIKGW